MSSATHEPNPRFDYEVRVHFGEFLRQCQDIKEPRTEFVYSENCSLTSALRFVRRLVHFGYDCEQSQDNLLCIKFKTSYTAAVYPPPLAAIMVKVQFNPLYSDEKEAAKDEYTCKSSPYLVQACHTCTKWFTPECVDFSYPRAFDPDEVLVFQGDGCAASAERRQDGTWSVQCGYGSKFDSNVYKVLDAQAMRLPGVYANYCDECIEKFVERDCLELVSTCN